MDTDEEETARVFGDRKTASVLLECIMQGYSISLRILSRLPIGIFLESEATIAMIK